MRFWPIVLASACAFPAWAGLSEAPQAVAVTIYRVGAVNTADLSEAGLDAGLALITETRTLDLPAGRSIQSFRGVADGLIPQSARIEGLPDAVIERNTDYDLLSPAALLEKAIGQTVHLIRTDPTTGRAVETPAIVRSGPGGAVLEIDGKFEALSCANLPERLIFDQLPPMADKPTLSMTIDAKQAGRRTVKLSYLTTGMTWGADYVAQVRPDGRTLDLLGWVTLANQTSMTFRQAPTQVVAGELSRDGDSQPIEVGERQVSHNCWSRQPPVLPVPPAQYRMAESYGGGGQVEEIVLTASRIAKQGDLGDYKLYTLPEPTTVAAHQIKQVVFLDQKAVPFERIYSYRLQLSGEEVDEDASFDASTVLRLRNTARAGLGKPLPAGVVSVMAADPQGRMILAGEDRVEKDTPIGLPLELTLGAAPDVTVEPTVVSDTLVGPGDRTRLELKVEFTNRKAMPVVMEYRHAVEEEGFKVVSASRRHTLKAGDPLWIIAIPAGGRQTLTYRVEYD